MFRKASVKDSRMYYPLKVVAYNNAYAIVDDRKMIIAEGLSKVVAEEFVGTLDTCAHALAHLQKAIILHNNSNVTSNDIRTFFLNVRDFLADTGVLPVVPKEIVDLSKIQCMDELF